MGIMKGPGMEKATNSQRSAEWLEKKSEGTSGLSVKTKVCTRNSVHEQKQAGSTFTHSVTPSGRR